jgi:hypothetical protein
MMNKEYGKQSMGKATQADIDRMARQGGENEVRASEDYNRHDDERCKPNQMTRSAPRKIKAMSRKKAEKGINPALEKAINELLAQVMVDPTATLTDKAKIIDRALKLEALKMKDADEGYGAGLFGDDDEET